MSLYPFTIDKIAVTIKFFKTRSYSRPLEPLYNVDFACYLNGDIKYTQFEKCRINAYKRMWWSTEGETVIVIKHGRVNSKGEPDYSFVYLEFNPNKGYPNISLFEFMFEREAYLYEINSIDLAFDVPGVTVDDVIFNAPSQSQTMSYGSIGGQHTKYLHPKANHGRVKVYDKYSERKQAQRRYPTIDPEKYKGLTRIEFTFHSIGYVLNEELFDCDLIKFTDVVRSISEVLVRSPISLNADTTISDIDAFVLDTFIELERPDLVQAYIRRRSVNNRSRLNAYVRTSHYAPLYNNSMTDVLKFHKDLRKGVTRVLPPFLYQNNIRGGLPL